MNTFLKSKIIEVIKDPRNTIDLINRWGGMTYTVKDANGQTVVDATSDFDSNMYELSVRGTRVLYLANQHNSQDKIDILEIIEACRVQHKKQKEEILKRAELNKARFELSKDEEKVLELLGYKNITPIKDIDGFQKTR